MNMPRLTEIFKMLYSIIRHRTWAVYDPADMYVLFVGKRRQCLKVQEENYGGLIVIPVDSNVRDIQNS